MKIRKILELNACGLHLVGYYEEGKVNPWRLYRTYWDGGKHRRLIAKYGCFHSISCHIHDIVSNTPETFQ